MTEIPEHRRLMIVAMVVAATVTAAAVAADTADDGAAPAASNEAPQAQERAGRFPIDLEQMKADAAQRFARVDADGDDAVSAEEFLAGAGEVGWPGRALRGDRGPGHRMGARGRGGDPAKGRRAGSRPFGGRPGGMRERMQAPEGASEEVFERADGDGDGALSRAEYGNLGEVRRELMRESVMARMFARLDTDDSGSLTGTELEPRIARLESLDADGDGQISRDEMPRRRGWR